MQGILAKMERDGLIVRLPDPFHGRILRSELTAQGRAMLLKAHGVVGAEEEIMLTSLGPDAVAALGDALAKCADDLA